MVPEVRRGNHFGCGGGGGGMGGCCLGLVCGERLDQVLEVSLQQPVMEVCGPAAAALSGFG